MSKITVRFTAKTRSASLNDVINIAEKYEHHIEGNYYFVHFEEPDNNLKNLLKLIKRWASTQILLGDQEVNVQTVHDIFFCQDKLLCGGICTHPRIKWVKLSEFIERIRIEEGVGFVDEYVIQSLTPFLEKIGDKEFKLNKEKMLDYIKNEWFFELEYCPLINIEKTLNLVKKYPDKITVREEFSDLSDKDSDYEDSDYEDSDMEYYKEIAEIFADVFENRLRKVLKEFHTEGNE